MWEVCPEDDYVRCHRWYEKKRPRELQAVLANLDTFLTALQSGLRLQQIKTGFLHPEPGGVLAIDQRGAKGRLAETRLYAFPDEETLVLHLLTIGDKRSQPADIRRCREFLSSLTRVKRASQTKRNDETTERQHGEEVQQRSRDGS